MTFKKTLLEKAAPYFIATSFALLGMILQNGFSPWLETSDSVFIYGSIYLTSRLFGLRPGIWSLLLGGLWMFASLTHQFASLSLFVLIGLVICYLNHRSRLLNLSQEAAQEEIETSY